jgi:hypothetical protein
VWIVKWTFALAVCLVFSWPAQADDAWNAQLTPLDDLGTREYAWGHFGGLYDAGSNTMAADHLADGLRAASRVRPLDANGQPSPDGRIVFLTIGTHSTARAFCNDAGDACETGSFVAAASALPNLNPALVFVNGSLLTIPWNSEQWMWDTDTRYDTVRDARLAAVGVTEAQVQVAWVELAEEEFGRSLPYQDSNAYRHKKHLGGMMRAMKARYPNLQIVYLSSAVYGGYASTDWAKEPFAYESGFAPRWLILQQIDQERSGFLTDTRIGRLEYSRGTAGWLAWGPYLWANGTTPRRDGLTWSRSDFEADGDTVSAAGAHKVALLLMQFLATEPSARPWMWIGQPPAGRTRAVRH